MEETLEQFEQLLLQYKDNPNYKQYSSFKTIVASLMVSCNLAKMKLYGSTDTQFILANSRWFNNQAAVNKYFDDERYKDIPMLYAKICEYFVG